MKNLSLPATCDRAAASTLLAELHDALGPAPLPVDASQVSRLGQTMLQVLVAASKTEAGIIVHNPSEAFQQTLNSIGLGSLLREWTAA